MRTACRQALKLICVSAGTIGVFTPSRPSSAADLAPVASAAAETQEGRALHATWTRANHRFTPEVKAAYLALVKTRAIAELEAAGETLPAEFLAWIDSDPVVEATVYGMKSKPANVLRILRSLELDLGPEVVRKEYVQLALAMAVSNAETSDLSTLGVSLAPRGTMKLVIPPSPRKPVDTKDPRRTLDFNDHIINFLNDTPLEYEVKIPAKIKGEPPTVEKRTRPLVGADVIMSKELQGKFNAYMAAHGHPEVKVDCLPPGPRPHAERGKTIIAGRLFHDAYVAKGLLPAGRDPRPTLAESMAYLARNDRFRFPKEEARVWPVFPLKAPWPVLTFLALDRQPLRELDDMWRTFVETGRPTRGGVAYIGWLAQHWDLHRARFIAPADFYYGSVQMNLKDGGVCGAQSTTWARSQLALGRPASTTRSRAHCGTTSIRHDPSTNTFSYGGGQTPLAWVFSNPRRGVVNAIYHHSTMSGVNYGLQSYLDSFMVVGLYELLSAEDRAAHGAVLLESGFEINPYNLLVMETLGRKQSTIEVLRASQKFNGKIAAMAAGKPGCPPAVLGLDGFLAAALVSGKIPTNPTEAAEIYAYLRQQAKPDPRALGRYRVAVEGLAAAQSDFEAQLSAHLAGTRDPGQCAVLMQKFIAVANLIADAAQRKAWAQKCLEAMAGQEMYLFRGYSLQLDATASTLARYAGQPLPAQAALVQPRLDEVTAQLRAHVENSASDPKQIPAIVRLVQVIVPQLVDKTQANAWVRQLLETLGDRPEYAAYRPVLAKVNWKIVSTSRQRGGRRPGLAAYAIDGNFASIWHTSHALPEDAPPHEIVVDLSEVKQLAGFTFMPRPKIPDGMVDAAAFYVSLDGKTWTLAAEGEFPNVLNDSMIAGKEEQRIACAPVEARYLKFVATRVVRDAYCTVSEIGVIEAAPPTNPAPR